MKNEYSNVIDKGNLRAAIRVIVISNKYEARISAKCHYCQFFHIISNVLHSMYFNTVEFFFSDKIIILFLTCIVNLNKILPHIA